MPRKTCRKGCGDVSSRRTTSSCKSRGKRSEYEGDSTMPTIELVDGMIASINNALEWVQHVRNAQMKTWHYKNNKADNSYSVEDQALAALSVIQREGVPMKTIRGGRVVPTDDAILDGPGIQLGLKDVEWNMEAENERDKRSNMSRLHSIGILDIRIIPFKKGGQVPRVNESPHVDASLIIFARRNGVAIIKQIKKYELCEAIVNKAIAAYPRKYVDEGGSRARPIVLSSDVTVSYTGRFDWSIVGVSSFLLVIIVLHYNILSHFHLCLLVSRCSGPNGSSSF